MQKWNSRAKAVRIVWHVGIEHAIHRDFQIRSISLVSLLLVIIHSSNQAQRVFRQGFAVTLSRLSISCSTNRQVESVVQFVSAIFVRRNFIELAFGWDSKISFPRFVVCQASIFDCEGPSLSSMIHYSFRGESSQRIWLCLCFCFIIYDNIGRTNGAYEDFNE